MIAEGRRSPDDLIAGRTALPAQPEPLGEARPARRLGWLASLTAFLALVAATVGITLVFWPGQVNFDTIGTLRDALAPHYSDWHSAVLTAGWRLLILAGLRSPGWVLAGGVLTLLLGLYLLLRLCLPRPLALLGAVLLFAFPPVLGFAVELGTDSWFGAPILCGFGFVARCSRTRGWSRGVSAMLAVVCALLAQAARPTAVPAVLALFAALGLVLLARRPRGWLRLLGPAAVGVAGAVAILGSILGLQYLVLHTEHTHPEQGTYEYDLVAMSIREHRMLLPPDVYPRQDLAYLTRYAVLPTGLDISSLWFGPTAVIAIPLPTDRLPSLQHAWLSAIREHPYDYLRVRASTAARQLAITVPSVQVHYGRQSPGYGVDATLYPALHQRGLDLMSVGATDAMVATGATGGPLYRVWVYVLVLLVAAVRGLWSRREADRIVALAGAALLMYSAEIVLFSPSVTYRYMFPTVAAGAVILVILTVDAARWLWRRIRPAALAGEG